MKNVTLKLLAIVLLFTVGGCGLSKMVKNADLVKYEVTPDPLEMHAGKVPVQITVNFPPKYFNKKAYVEFTPVLVSSDGNSQIDLEMQTIQGEKVLDNNPVISYANGGTITYNDTLDYDPVYRMSDLQVKVNAHKGGNGKNLSFAVVTIAHGIITTPELVDNGLAVDNGTLEGTDKGMMKTMLDVMAAQPKPQPQSKKLVLYYPLQKDKLTYKEKKKADIDSFLNTVKDITNNPDINLQGVDIASYASPDGPQDLNHNLVEGRYTNSNKFIQDKFKKEKIENNDFLTRETTPDEDWEGFKNLVQQSDLEDKDLILRVLSMYSDPDVREREIKNMAAVYDQLRNEILPKLRRAEIIAKYQEREKSVEELINLGKTSPSSLSQDELFFAAQEAQGTDKENIYKTYTAQYTDDWKGFNNLGVYYLEQNRLDDAELQLQKAENIDANNAAVINNLGVVYWEKGDYDKAEEYFKKASQINPSNAINYNLGVICIKKGMYDKAVEKFGSTASFNKSLAQLLAGNTQDAINTLGQVKSEDAYYYYLKAVEAARNNDANGVFTNLSTAIKKNADLKDYAANDMEFRAYFEDDSFKSIVQ